MRFEEAYGSCKKKKLTQKQAAMLLGVSDRTFRRYIKRYEEEGLEGLLDKRLNSPSRRKAPVDEVMQVENLYRDRYQGFNARHFYSKYSTEHDGKRGYTWVKITLQARSQGKGGKGICYTSG